MHTRAAIQKSDVGNGYVVIYPSISQILSRYFESFEDASKWACEWVNWEMEYLTINILPDELRQVVDMVKENRRKEFLKGKVEKVRKMWGDKAAQAAEIHIKRDEYGIVPECDKSFMIRMAFKPHIYQAFLKEYEDEKN